MTMPTPGCGLKGGGGNNYKRNKEVVFLAMPSFWMVLVLGIGAVLLDLCLLQLVDVTLQQGRLQVDQYHIKEMGIPASSSAAAISKINAHNDLTLPVMQGVIGMESRSSEANKNNHHRNPTAYVKSITKTGLKRTTRKGAIIQHKIALMIEGPAQYAQQWADRLQGMTDVVLFYHSYDHDCEHCIYNNQTTISSGRNLLLRQALQYSADHRKPTKFNKLTYFYYYVLCDYDLVMKCDKYDQQDAHGCWRDYVSYLQDHSTNYSVHMPKTWHDTPEEGETSSFQTCVDGAIKAVRFDFIPMFWPHTTSHDHVALNLNDEFWWHITQRCFPYLIMTDHRWHVENPAHSDYPHQYGTLGGPALLEMLQGEYPNLAGKPWDAPSILAHEYMNHRCEVKDASLFNYLPPIPDARVWMQCQLAFQKRFDDWEARRGRYADGF